MEIQDSRLATVALAAFLTGGVATCSLMSESASNPGDKVVPVIDLKGIISDGGSGTLNIDGLRGEIDGAFNKPNAVAVALNVNSPGGSPAQSELIAGHIRRRAEEKKLPVYAFVQDVAASGGYWIVCGAADEIYTAETSMIGSIGVVTESIGYAKLANALGVEARVHTAGKHKRGLNPLKPENPADVTRLQTELDTLHALFKDHVRDCRKGKLTTQRDLDNEVFDGSHWFGREAKEIGLTDGIGQMELVLKEKFGDDVKVVRTERGISLATLLAGGVAQQSPQASAMDPEAVGRGAAQGLVEEARKESTWAPYRIK